MFIWMCFALSAAASPSESFFSEKTFVVIIQGGLESFFSNTSRYVFEFFKRYQIPEDRILVLSPYVEDGGENDYDGDGASDIHWAPACGNIEKALRIADQRTPFDGQIIIVLNAHGFYGAVSRMRLHFPEDTGSFQKWYLSAPHLKRIMDQNIHPNIETILLVDSCQSGGFQMCGGLNRLIFTSSDTESPSYTFSEMCFLSEFLQTLDGGISFREAFEYVRKQPFFGKEGHEPWDLLGIFSHYSPSRPTSSYGFERPSSLCAPASKGQMVIERAPMAGAVSRYVPHQYIDPGDVNFSGSVDEGDIQMLQSVHWEGEALSLSLYEKFIADINSDGVVDAADYILMLSNCGKRLPPRWIQPGSYVPVLKRAADENIPPLGTDFLPALRVYKAHRSER